MVRMAVIDVVQPDVMFDSLDIDHSGLVTIEEILLLGNVVDAPFVLWSPEQFREAAGTPADARSFNQEQFLKWFASVKDSWTVEAEDMRMLIDGGHNLLVGLLSSAVATLPARSVEHDFARDLRKALQPIVDEMAHKYNCSISVALRAIDNTHNASNASFAQNKPIGATGVSQMEVSVASGVTDRSTKRAASISDPYVWGSVTKIATGASVLRLVDAGELSLETRVAPIIDMLLAKMKAKDPAQDFERMSDLWGDEVRKITVEDLLGMKSGVPDYDTATPSRGNSTPTDSFRADCYAHPSRAFSPQALISVPWARTGALLFRPGHCPRYKYYNCYSSTNYVLLGLLLASHAGADSWEEYAQASGLRPAVADFANLSFAVAGPPAAWTPVVGYDETHYNGNDHPIEVSQVVGVFGGWTASDIVLTAADAATLAFDVYGPEYRLVSKRLVELMYAASATTGYGLATFNLTRLTPNDVAYGHLGATYGYQSIVAYAPALQLALAIGTNIETDYQTQPSETFCYVYNTAKAILLGRPLPRCSFKPGYFFSGECICN